MSREAIRLPAEARSAGAARRALAPHLAALPQERRPDALLLVSELVTNAFRHGAPPISLTIDSDGRRLRIEVSDTGGGRPQRRADPGADGGWGLLLVETAADRWGVAEGRTSVWFELDAAS